MYLKSIGSSSCDRRRPRHFRLTRAGAPRKAKTPPGCARALAGGSWPWRLWPSGHRQAMRAAWLIIYGPPRPRQRATASNAPGRSYASRPFPRESPASPAASSPARLVAANGADWSTASNTWCRANSRAALRVAQVVLVNGRLDLVALADHRASDEQAREEVAGEVHEQRARTGGDHAAPVDFDHQADAAMDVLVGDVLRQPRVAREEVGLQVVTSDAGGPGPRKDPVSLPCPGAPCAPGLPACSPQARAPERRPTLALRAAHGRM